MKASPPEYQNAESGMSGEVARKSSWVKQVQERGIVMELRDLPELFAVLVEQKPGQVSPVVTFKDEAGAKFIPIFSARIDLFNQWADGGGKKIAQENGVSKLLLMGMIPEQLKEQIKVIGGPVDLHYLPEVGKLTVPPARRIRIP